MTWSPDGTQLAFQSSDRFPALYVVGADGRGLRLLVQGTRGDAIAWLPSVGRAPSSLHPAVGTTRPSGLTTTSPLLLPGVIAFSHYTDDNEEAADVYTVHSDGSGLVRLTANPGNDRDQRGRTMGPGSCSPPIARGHRTPTSGS